MLTTNQRLTHEEAVALAKKLAEKARGRIHEGEILNRQPDETIQEIVDSGLVRALQPLRFHGHELMFDTLVDTTIEMAKANPASGWCYTLLLVHQWMLAGWPEEAQREIWSANPDANIATAFASPKDGKIERVEGGYRISGIWPYSSGVYHSEWVMVTAYAPAPDDEGRQVRTMFLVPREEYEILDDWKVTGLRASGSNSLVVKDAFVPDYRTVNIEKWSEEGISPGMVVNPGPQYQLPLSSAIPTCLVSAVFGATIGAYELYVENVKSKMASGLLDPSKTAHVQHRISEMSATLDALDGLIRKSLALLRSGSALTKRDKVRLMRNYAYIARSCSKIADEIFQYSGSSALYDSTLSQLYWRDIKTMSMHGQLNFDAASLAYGSYELGITN